MVTSCTCKHFFSAGGEGAAQFKLKGCCTCCTGRGLRRPKKSPPLSLISSCWECWFVLLHSVETEAVFVNVALSRKNVSSLRCPLGRAVAECHHLCCERVFQDISPSARRKTFSEAIKC